MEANFGCIGYLLTGPNGCIIGLVLFSGIDCLQIMPPDNWIGSENLSNSVHNLLDNNRPSVAIGHALWLTEGRCYCCELCCLLLLFRFESRDCMHAVIDCAKCYCCELSFAESKAVIGRALWLTVQSVIAVSSHWPSRKPSVHWLCKVL